MNVHGKTCSTLALFALALTGAAASHAQQASAAAATRIPQTHLIYSDLDINSSAGVRTLYGRIRKAAEMVCGERRSTGSRIVRKDWQDCHATAVADAVARLDKPALNAYHRRQAAAAG